MADQAPSGPDAQDEVASFVRSYVPHQVERIRFAWNGKHAKDFVDSNHAFRSAVIEYVRAHPGEAATELLTDLFRESASCSLEAWGAPLGFEEIAAALLVRRGEDALPDFRWGLGQSFDVFGACHHMRLDPALARRLQIAAGAGVAAASPEDRGAWEEIRDLFGKLSDGTATKGWAAIGPGTPVENVRVVPGWEVRLRLAWTWLRRALSGDRT